MAQFIERVAQGVSGSSVSLVTKVGRGQILSAMIEIGGHHARRINVQSPLPGCNALQL